MSAFDATAVRRIIRAHGKTVGDTGGEWELAELVAVRDELEGAIAAAVSGLRDRGLSWSNVGDALGVTKSAAYQRYGKAKAVVGIGNQTPPPAEGEPTNDGTSS